jgi:hypothetical protein
VNPTLLINVKKYVTMTGQLRSMARNPTGDTVVTTVTTIKCLVYQDSDEQRTTNPTITDLDKHFAIVQTAIPLGVVIKLHDHLSVVVNQYGESIIDDARITKITAWGSWRRKVRFNKLDLALQLDGS